MKPQIGYWSPPRNDRRLSASRVVTSEGDDIVALAIAFGYERLFESVDLKDPKNELDLAIGVGPDSDTSMVLSLRCFFALASPSRPRGAAMIPVSSPGLSLLASGNASPKTVLEPSGIEIGIGLGAYAWPFVIVLVLNEDE